MKPGTAFILGGAAVGVIALLANRHKSTSKAELKYQLKTRAIVDAYLAEADELNLTTSEELGNLWVEKYMPQQQEAILEFEAENQETVSGCKR